MLRVIGVSVEDLTADERVVTVKFSMSPREELEASDIDRVFDIAKEVGGAQHEALDALDRALASRDAGKMEPPGSPKTDAPSAEQGQPASGGGRRRTGNFQEPAAPLTPSTGRRGASRPENSASASDAEPQPSTSSAQLASSGRRKSGATGGAPSSMPLSEPSQSPAPSAAATSRRRTGAGSGQPSATTATSHSEGDQEPGERAANAGRRRSSGPSVPASPSSDTAGITRHTHSAGGQDDKISDADLSKAVSLAAQEVGDTKKVQEFVASFGVRNVGKVPQEQRATFLRKLDQFVAMEK